MVKPIVVEVTLRVATSVFSLIGGVLTVTKCQRWKLQYDHDYDFYRWDFITGDSASLALLALYCAALFLQVLLEPTHIYASVRGLNAKVKPLYVISMIVGGFSFVFAILTTAYTSYQLEQVTSDKADYGPREISRFVFCFLASILGAGISIVYYVQRRRGQANTASSPSAASTPSEDTEKATFSPNMASPLFSMPHIMHSNTAQTAFNDGQEEKEVAFSAHQWTTEAQPPKREQVKVTSRPKAPPKATTPAPAPAQPVLPEPVLPEHVLPEPNPLEMESQDSPSASTPRVHQPQPRPSGPKVNPLFTNVHR